MDVLRRTPGTLLVLLGDLDEAWSRATEGPETFSPFDVVGHLIDGEETDWIPRARIILARGPNPAFEPYDRFRHQGRNARRSLTSLLKEFGRLRAANLELLRSWQLTEAICLPARTPGFCRVTPQPSLGGWCSLFSGTPSPGGGVLVKKKRETIGPRGPFSPG